MINQEKINELAKAFDDVAVEGVGNRLSVISTSFGIVDLKVIRKIGFEITSIYRGEKGIQLFLEEVSA